MTENKGRIITFYSYKGGVGRTMALANVSVLLARWGYRTLIIDWDLEAPGLENFFNKYASVERVAEQRGIIDILSSCSANGAAATETVNWREHIFKISLEGNKAPLHLLTAGKRDKEKEYFKKVRNFDVQEFYQKNEGSELIEQLRREWCENYDFILIDSRTGITDIGGICTIQLPDILVLLFTATEQGLNGTINVAKRAVSARDDLPFDRVKLMTLPIASRLDVDKEFELSKRWIERSAKRLAHLYADWLPMKAKEQDILNLTKISYKAYFSFEEKLAVIEESQTDRGSLRDAYTTLAALLASELQDVDQLLKSRDEYVNLAAQAEIEEKLEAKAYISHDHRVTDRDWLIKFARKLQDELRLQTGGEFEVLLNMDNTTVGQSLNEATFLIPIITPGYFKSTISRSELEKFLHRERKLGRHDLIYPIYFVDTPLLQTPELLAEDDLAKAISNRVWFDWRDLRFEEPSSPKLAREIARLALGISEGFYQKISSHRTLKVWNAETGRILRSLEGHSDTVNGCAFSPDGELIVSASSDRTLKVWDAVAGRVLRSLEGHSDSVNGCSFAPDGRLIVSASTDRTLKVWDADTGRMLRSLEGHSDSVNGCSFAPDGRLIVSASTDLTLKLWNAETGRMLRSLEGHSDPVIGCGFSPDGELIVSASADRTLKVWEAETGRMLRSLEGHSDIVNGCAFSPDGELIVSASADRTLKVWEADTGRMLRSLEGHSDIVNGCAFSPDGERIVSA